jgi:hypothetical protein
MNLGALRRGMAVKWEIPSNATLFATAGIGECDGGDERGSPKSSEKIVHSD